MQHDPVVFYIFVIFAGSAVIATLALFTRQALLVAYIFLGVLVGPGILGIITDPFLIKELAHIGIIFLLFLMGLDLNPKELLLLLRKTTVVTVISSLVFALVGASIALAFGFEVGEALVIGGAMMFSSTIIGLKLLPTTVLHHQRTGDIVISILLLQDLIAILFLLVLEGQGAKENQLLAVLQLALALPLLVGGCLIVVRTVMIPLLRRFDKIQEYIFLLAIGWCLGVAELASLLGLSQEIGAYIAGVALAYHPIALFMAEKLKELRDFFLVMFFVALGAGFDLSMLGTIWLPALVIGLVMMLIKPPVFSALLVRTGEPKKRSMEIGMRLGQLSEFSLLVAALALGREVIGDSASYLIQLSTLVTFLISVYLVVLRYPTPLALSDELRRD